jgi:hypothetical protein
VKTKVVSCTVAQRFAASTVFSLLMVFDALAVQTLQLTYPPEIFDFCVYKHGTTSARTGTCLETEERRRIELMRKLQKELGRRSAAQAIYNQCRNRFADRGVYPIESCAIAIIAAAKDTGSYDVARRIYDGCVQQWGRGKVDAASRCSKADARYYKRHGRIPE